MANALKFTTEAVGARQTARDVDRIATSVDRTQDELEQTTRAARRSDRAFASMGRNVRVTGRHMGGMGRGIASAAVAPFALAGGLYGLYRATGYAVTAAVDLGEQQSKNDQVFRDSSAEVKAFARTTSTAYGMSERAALEAAGTLGNMLVPMGVARRQAAGMSTRLVGLAGDMASFNNASPEKTLDALRAGLSGETEPLRRFGVFLSAARVEQEALKVSGKDNAKKLTQDAKAQAAYNLILRDTKDQHGDVGRTYDSLANAQRRLAAQREEISAIFGKLTLPVLEPVAGAASDVLKSMQKTLTDDDLSVDVKLNRIKASAKHHFGPLVKVADEALEEWDVAGRLGEAFDEAAPVVADKAAELGIAASGKLLEAWWGAGWEAKLITGAMLGAKLGVFGWFGNAAAQRFVTGFRRRSPAGALSTAVAPRGAAARAGRTGRQAGGAFGSMFGRRSGAVAASTYGRSFKTGMAREKGRTGAAARNAGQNAGRSFGGRGGSVASATFASGMAAQMPASMKSRRGKFKGAIGAGFKGIGGTIGAALGIEIGLAIYDELKKDPKFGQYSGWKGWGELGRDAWETLPGTDDREREPGRRAPARRAQPRPKTPPMLTSGFPTGPRPQRPGPMPRRSAMEMMPRMMLPTLAPESPAAPSPRQSSPVLLPAQQAEAAPHRAARTAPRRSTRQTVTNVNLSGRRIHREVVREAERTRDREGRRGG